MGKSILGDEFWGQWYRIDKLQYTEERLRKEVDALDVQTTLEHQGTTISMEELRKNMLKVKQHLRFKGFRVPCASDARVVCVWDLQARACNSSYLMAYLVQCDNTPEEIKSKYVQKVAQGRTVEKRVGKRQCDEITAAAVEMDAPVKDEPQSGKVARKDLHTFSERKLTIDEIQAVDERLARFCYSEGLPFKALANAELRGALRKLNASWAEGTRLSDWTLRHHFLDNEYERVTGEAAEKITGALFVCLISDGWSGVQKRHVLNLILATPEPVFIRNVETGEDSVTGEYQAKLFAATIKENGGMAKVPAICTDNASVMRKCWRLLRQKFHGLFTFGCAPHAFQLHAQDVCAIDEFSALVGSMRVINNWFAVHLQAGGRATLSRLQRSLYGKESAPFQPGKTREWNGQVACGEWNLANRSALVRLVTEPDFDSSKENAQKFKETILDLENKFWPRLPEFVALMQPLRLAIHTLQGDHSKLSDVFGAFVRVHSGLMEMLAPEKFTFEQETRDELMDTFSKRFKFLYHPIHLITFALDPRYAKVCKAAPSVLRHWMKQLHGVAADDTALVNDFGLLRASFNDTAQADIWTPEATSDPVKWWRSWGDEFPVLKKLALKLLSLPPSAASAERNWSTQDFIVSKRRNRLKAIRAEKLIYIYFNLRSLAQAEARRRGPGITDEALERWHASLIVHDEFRWPMACDGEHMFSWDADADDGEFDGMHGDEMFGGVDEDVDEEEADRQAEEAAFKPFEPEDFTTPGSGFEVLPCPNKLPHDLEVSQKLARWFGPPYNAWYVGNVAEINKRRTKTENISVEFKDDVHGVTRGTFVAEAETYGANKLWVVLKPIPIELDDNDKDEDSGSQPPSLPPSLPSSPSRGASQSSDPLSPQTKKNA